jgi:hypothetical protein
MKNNQSHLIDSASSQTKQEKNVTVSVTTNCTAKELDEMYSSILL